MKGQLIQNQYLVLKTLGQDTFSETFLARRKAWLNRRRYIIKKFRPILGNPHADEIGRTFYREANILQRLSGSDRQIPQLYDYFTVGENFYIVREWIDGLTLKQKVEQQGKLPEAEVEQILESILGCLNYIHSYGIVYRQLKPSSIILRKTRWGRESPTSYLPVPIYFGGVKKLATESEQSDRCNIVLTERYGYIPLEQQQGKSVYASDIYSLGLTAIYLLTGKNPAELPVDSQTRKILWHQEVPQLNIHLCRTLDRAICPYPEDRFTSAKAMLQALHSLPVTIPIPFSDVPRHKFAGSEVKIVTLLSSLGLGVLGITYTMLNLEALTPFYKVEAEEISDSTTEVQIEAVIPSFSSNPASKIEPRTPPSTPLFTVGIPQQQAIARLGQPSKQSKGYWQNSRVLLYRDFISGRIDLGYLVDTDTNIIRQSEMTFSPSVDVQTIQQYARQLLADNYSPEILRQIDLVYSNQSDCQEFKVNDIEGIVQRNPENFIYFAIWDSQFH